MTGLAIAREAMNWLGTPHVDNSMAKGHGVDCAHLMLGVLIDANLIGEGDMHIEHYSNEWHLHRSEDKFLKYMELVAYEVDIDDLQMGDFILYQYGRCISHGAIYIGDNMVVHAYVGMGVIISSLDDIIFYDGRGNSRMRKVYRYKESD